MKTINHCGQAFEIAESEAEFRALYSPPSDLSKLKTLTQLDEHCRNFIARSPFFCLATAAPDGQADISPRGDPPGFVRILDSTTLFLPDRLGNNRLDSLSNLVRNPELALIFFIPGVDETLRVNGRGQVVLGSPLLEACAFQGKTPRTGILVEVREAFLQCAKALRRSKLWSAELQLPRQEFPTLGKMLADQIGGPMCVAELDERIETAYREKMY